MRSLLCAPRRPRLLASALVGCTLAFAPGALAQDPFGPGLSPGFGPSGGGARPSGKPKAEPKKNPDEPELHAAGGGDSLIPEGHEPTLPLEPLKLRPELLAQIGSDADPDAFELGRAEKTRRFVLPPYYREQSGSYRFRTVFPLWAERDQPSRTQASVRDRAAVYGGLYFRRRSAEVAQDVLFPLVWNLTDRTQGSRTTVVGPFVNRSAPNERDDWFLPFYATGQRKHGGYTVLPPLLTALHRDEEGGFSFLGPAYCVWEGGASCDARTAQKLKLGVAPFYFFGQTEETKYEIIPPLLHFYRYTDRRQSYTNVWGPYFRRHTQRSQEGKLEDWNMLHLLPLYFSQWGPNQRHTTVLPFFHYGYDRDEKSWLFVNPLFLARRGDEGEHTFVTWGYARHRGRTKLDMITPLYWHMQDPDTGTDEKLLFPFLYSKTSPRESTQAFFPFWAHSDRFAIKQTTWITPFFQHTHHLRGWATNIHPILYLGKNGNNSHTVVAPFFWDFVGLEQRFTAGFPFYWRFADKDSVSQLVVNTYYREKQIKDGRMWQFHFFPFFSYGETPDGHWWNLLYGLAGYTRRGDLVKVRTLWVPITVSSPARVD
jgi:hypothetical protein